MKYHVNTAGGLGWVGWGGVLGDHSVCCDSGVGIHYLPLQSRRLVSER